MSFFNKFPIVQYDLLGDGNLTDVPNIFIQIKAIDSKYDSITPYQFYEVTDERPDQLSYKLYGSTDYHWTFFVINDHLKHGYNNWPMGDQQIAEYSADTFRGYAITMFREESDDINYNSIDGKFPVGDVITGATSGATATVTGRNTITNQLQFEYNTETRFASAEIISNASGQTIQPNYDVKLHKDSVKYYIDSTGEKVSNYENIRLPGEYAVSYQLDVSLQNDRNRYVRVLRSEFIRDFTVTYRKVLNGK